jgi:hypothetical protein
MPQPNEIRKEATRLWWNYAGDLDAIVNGLDKTKVARTTRQFHTEESQRDDDLFFSVQADYPDKITLSGTVIVDLNQLIEDMIYAEFSGEGTPASVQAFYDSAVTTLDADFVSNAMKNALKTGKIVDALTLDQLDNLYETIATRTRADMTAYQDQWDEVELPEYPGSFFRYMFRDQKITVGQPKRVSDLVFEVPLSITWKPEIIDWSYGTSFPEGLGWNASLIT